MTCHDSLRLLLGGAVFGGAVVYACVRDRLASGKQIEARTASGTRRAAKRHAGVIKLRPEMYDQYTQLHDAVWPEVSGIMYACNMRNFVVYYDEAQDLMFHHWEYVGNDFDADMARLAADPISDFWWSFCEPCQVSLHPDAGEPPSKGGKVWWKPLTCLTSVGAWPTSWCDELTDPDFVPMNRTGKPATTRTTPPPVHNRDA